MFYIIATPIGNLRDISYRAIDTLKECDLILCEDTRHSLLLLNKYEIKKPIKSYHKFNERERIDEILVLLREGKNIGLISDAGTPVISDPGNILISELIKEGVEITSIPGACAAINALVLSGMNADKWTFMGFIPKNNAKKECFFRSVSEFDGSLVFYISPHSYEEEIKSIYDAMGKRKAVLIREMTKVYEEKIPFVLGEQLKEGLKGEMVLIVEGKEQENELLSLTPEEHLQVYLDSGMEKNEAIKLVAKERGVHKSIIYKLAIKNNN